MRKRSRLGFAYQDRAQALDAPDDRSVGRTMPAFVDGRAIFRDQILGPDYVLHAKRDAGERTVRHLRLRKHLDPRVNGRIHALDALQASRHCFFSGSAVGSKPVLEAF